MFELQHYLIGQIEKTHENKCKKSYKDLLWSDIAI